MKTRRPVETYEDDRGYPSVAQVLSRRDFLTRALSGATALGALMVVPSAAWATRRKKSTQVVVRLQNPVRFWSCRYEVYQVSVVTGDRGLAAFLTTASEARGIDAALVAVLSASKCEDLTKTKRLKKLHRRLGQALAAHYKKRTRRSTRTPQTRLAVRRIKRGPPVPGGLRPPVQP